MGPAILNHGQDLRSHTFILTSRVQEWKSQAFAHHMAIVGATLKNHLPSTLIQNYGYS